MAALTSKMKEALNQSELLPFATASDSGIPNVVPVKFIFIMNNDELWLVDNFMVKTLSNMRQNPNAALYVYVAKDNICFQIKGEVKIHTSGEDYKHMKEIMSQKKPDAPAKSLAVLKITEIYQCIPGNDVGKRIH